MTDTPRHHIPALAAAACVALVLAACGAIASPDEAAPPTATPAASAAEQRIVAASWEMDGPDVRIHVEASGFEVRLVQGDTSGRTGHLHLFVDRAPVAAGGQIGFEEGIIHTVTRDILVPDLSPGSHTIWVVAADGADQAFDPLVATRLDVTVE